jgi:hypothetical protein
MRKSFLILSIAILTFTSCVTRPYTIDDPHRITDKGASWALSLVPGLTQFINGEYLEGSFYLLGTSGAAIISGLAYNGIIPNPVISSTRSNDDPTKMNEARLSILFYSLSASLWLWSYSDGVYSTYKMNNQKFRIENPGFKNKKEKTEAEKLKLEEEAREKRILDLKEKYELTDDQCTLIKKHKIYIGMPEDALVESWGTPRDINRNVGYWGVHKQYVYGDFPNSYYVYVDNGVVTSWQD